MTRVVSSNRLRQLCLAAVFTIVASGVLWARQPPGVNAALEWNAIATRAFLPTQGSDPLSQSRAYAMLHAAIHDALNAIHQRYEFYTPGLTATPGASPDAAVAAAAHAVLVALIPRSCCSSRTRTSCVGRDSRRGREREWHCLGESAADLILERRTMTA